MANDELFNEIEEILAELSLFELPSLLFGDSPTHSEALRRFVQAALTSSAQERDMEMFLEQLTTFGFQMFLAGRAHANRGLACEDDERFILRGDTPAELFSYLDRGVQEDPG
jgi:hypothetical protein